MAIKFVELNRLLYEVDEKGEKVLVRSTDSTNRAYIRFSNKTGRPVDIFWRDFRGTKHHYMTLAPRGHYDVNTFITHPWEFIDVDTMERYVINNVPIFRAPANLGGMMYRTNWNITIPVRTLRQTALLKLALTITQPCCARSIGLPRILENDLEELIKLLHRPESPVERQND